MHKSVGGSEICIPHSDHGKNARARTKGLRALWRSISARRAGTQFDDNRYDAQASAEEANLTLTNGTPRLWIMCLKRNGLAFSKMARHRRVSQCLGSLQGKEWFIAVAPPNDLADGTCPDLARLAAFESQATASSSFMSPRGTPVPSFCMTSVYFSILRTWTPTSAILTPMICRMSFKSYHNGFGSNALGEPTQPLTRKSPAGPHKPFANYSYCVVSAYKAKADNRGRQYGAQVYQFARRRGSSRGRRWRRRSGRRRRWTF